MAQYYMNISGANYQILNSSLAVIESSTSSSTAFNYLLGQTPVAATGDQLYVVAGAYFVDSPWVVGVISASIIYQQGAILTASSSWRNSSGPYFLGNYIVSAFFIQANSVTIFGLTLSGDGLNMSPSPSTLLTGSNIPYEMAQGIVVGGYGGGSYNISNFTLLNSTIYNFRLNGVNLYGDNNGCQNCTIYNIGANGLTCSAGNGGYFVNNNIYGCSDVAIDALGYSVSYVTNLIVTDNFIHDCNSSDPMVGFTNYGCWAIGIEQGTGTGSGNYLLIANNTITNIGTTNVSGMGIAISGATTYNNYILICGNNLTTIGAYGISIMNNTSASYNIIEYNTINGALRGVYLDSSAISTDVYSASMSYSNCSTNFVDNGTGTVTTAPSIIALQVTSSPTGSGFIEVTGTVNNVYVSNYVGYAGMYSTSPLTFYATIGASVTLIANTVGGYSFTNWSDSGSQTHSIGAPSLPTTYTATYSPSLGGYSWNLYGVGVFS